MVLPTRGIALVDDEAPGSLADLGNVFKEDLAQSPSGETFGVLMPMIEGSVSSETGVCINRRSLRRQPAGSGRYKALFVAFSGEQGWVFGCPGSAEQKILQGRFLDFSNGEKAWSVRV